MRECARHICSSALCTLRKGREARQVVEAGKAGIGAGSGSHQGLHAAWRTYSSLTHTLQFVHTRRRAHNSSSQCPQPMLATALPPASADCSAACSTLATAAQACCLALLTAAQPAEPLPHCNLPNQLPALTPGRHTPKPTNPPNLLPPALTPGRCTHH